MSVPDRHLDRASSPPKTGARASVVVAAALAVLAAGCGGSVRPQPTPLPIPGSRTDQVLTLWFTCDECYAGELDSVLALGPGVIPLLESALEAPPAARHEEVRQQLSRLWGEVNEDRANRGEEPPLSEAAYIQRYLENFIARYQSRAAVALGAFGTPEATRALELALDQQAKRGYRDDVIDFIERALSRGSSP